MERNHNEKQVVCGFLIQFESEQLYETTSD